MSASPPPNGRNASPDRRSLSRGRSASPKARSPTPADRSPVPRSRSRSPRRRSPSRSPARRRRSSTPPRRRRRSSTPPRRRRSPSRDRYRSRSRDRDYRRRSRSRDRGGYGGDRGGYGRRSPPPPRYGGGFDSRGRSPPRGMGRRATPPATGLHMFVAGLNFICTEKELERKFEKYGRVMEARVVRNPSTGESRGFGFVAMDHDDEVDEAVKDLNGAEWNGRRLLVERARHVR